MEPAVNGPAGTGKVRFGVFEFDRQSRELTKQGTRIHLQEQPFVILAALLEEPGREVPREDLQHRLWPDGTFVEYEQSLNKAVNKLREALGDSAGHPVYIETLPRRGYRFVAPVERETAPQAEVQRAASKRRRILWLIPAGIIVASAVGVGLRPVDVPRVKGVVQLTNDSSYKRPPLICDGSRVVYRDDQNKLWAVPVSGGQPKRVHVGFLPHAPGIELGGYSPVLRQFLVRSFESDVQHLWLAGLDGESGRRVAELPISSWAAISPDGQRLAISVQDGVYVQSIVTRQRKRLLKMQWDMPHIVWWHPFGHTIGFIDISGERSLLRPWQVDDDGSHARPVVPEDIQPAGAGVWSNDGHRFYYFRMEGEIYVRITPDVSAWLRRPVVARLTASGQLRGLPAIDPADSKRLYATGVIQRGETVRYDRKTRRWIPFLPSFSGESVSRSPDGQWLAYVTFPGAELHKCRPDGSGDIVLAPGVTACNPSWSPDGKRIGFAGIRRGAVGEFNLWFVSAEGGDAAPYRPEIASGYDTIWSKDGTRILFAPYTTRIPPGESRIKILHLKTGAIEQIPGGDDLFSPRWSPDEQKMVAVQVGTFQLSVYDARDRRWRRFDDVRIGFPTWSPNGKSIYAKALERPSVVRIDVETGRVHEILKLDFRTVGNNGPWLGWTDDWEPIVVRDLSSRQIFRLDLDR